MKKPLFYYKFVSYERIDILKNGLIRFTPAKKCNDPFEIMPTITPISSEYIEYFLNLNQQQRDDLHFSDDDYHYSIMRKEKIEEKRKLFQEKIDKMGILSLSSNLKINQLLTVSVPDKNDPRTNLIMWSHYADSHKGFVIEFRENFIENIEMKKVDYNDERNILTYEDIDHNNFDGLFFKKSTEWEYEQEYRAILELDKADKTITTDNDEIHLFKINKKKIKSITFGCRMSNDNKRTIMDIIKNDNEYNDVSFNHAYLNDTGYFLNFYYDDGRFTNNPEFSGQYIPIHKKI